MTVQDTSNVLSPSPCPFCGGKKLQVWKNTVLCDECGASGPDLGHTDDRPGAVAAWNKRAHETKAPISALVDRFLGWKLPKSVCSDQCVTDSNYPHERSGTNLLTASEARQMLEHVLGITANPKAFGPGMTPHAADCQCYVCCQPAQLCPHCGKSEPHTHRVPGAPEPVVFPHGSSTQKTDGKQS